MKSIGNPISSLRVFVNTSLEHTEPWKVVTITTASVLSSIWIFQFVFQDESLSERAKNIFFKWVKKIPIVAKKLKSEMNSLSNRFAKDVESRVKDVPYILSLPPEGWSEKEVLSHVNKCLSLGDFNWKLGHVSGTVYYHNQELAELLGKVYSLTSYTNPLHPDVFPGVCKMEAEVVRMTAELFHGGPLACGTMTTGGSESILMACKALRDYAFNNRGIKHGEIILPRTAHPAFNKAASYLSMRITYVEVDPDTWTANISKMERAISRNTVMLVGSMPNYPYGTADNIEAIAALGRKYNIPVHVDCCLGGFLTSFMPAAGFSLPPYDFAVPGVVSISVDPHKYGFTPKGASVVLYAEGKYRHSQYTVTTDWPGGIYGSPTVSGSRPGGTIAACWATMVSFGLEGYIHATKKIISTTKYIESKLREMNELFIFGTPATSVIALGSKVFHIYKLSEVLGAKGWNLNVLQFPSGVHFCVTHMQTEEGVADKFLQDVKIAIAEIMKSNDPKDLSEGKMAMYGMAQSLPDRSIVGDITCSYIDSLYYTPKRQQSVENGRLVN